MTGKSWTLMGDVALTIVQSDEPGAVLSRKINSEQAEAILASDEPGTVLAERYGVSNSAISRIRTGRNHAYLDPSKRRTRRSVRKTRTLLTEEQAKSIIASRESAHSRAETYGVAQATITSVRSGRTWPHLDRTNRPAEYERAVRKRVGIYPSWELFMQSRRAEPSN